MTWLKDNWYWLLTILVVIVVMFAIMRGCGGGSETITKHDTTIVEKIKYQESQDTVVKWYEITKTITKSDTVFEQKLDSIQIVKYYDRDLIPHLRKEGNVIILQTVNFEGKVIREWRFDDIGRNFAITGVKNDVIVKKELIYWDGIWTYGNYLYPIKQGMKWTDGEATIGLKTGLNYLDKMKLNLKTEYDIERKDIMGGIEFEMKIK